MRLRLVWLLATAVALGTSQIVLAGEGPTKPPRKKIVVKAPVYKAPRPVVHEAPSGFYVGGHIGGG